MRGFLEPVTDQKVLRIAFRPNESKRARVPSNPIRGRGLAVLGSSAGVAGKGVGSAAAIRIGTSAGGAGGGGGIVPVNFRCCSTTLIGSSTTLVAATIIPFFKPKASVSWPSTMNFWPFGILNSWLVPSSKVKITVLGGEICHTFPVTLFTVVMVLGVVVTMVVRCSFMPGFRE